MCKWASWKSLGRRCISHMQEVGGSRLTTTVERRRRRGDSVERTTSMTLMADSSDD